MKNDNSVVIIAPNLLGRIFGKLKRLELKQDVVLFTDKNGETHKFTI